MNDVLTTIRANKTAYQIHVEIIENTADGE
jgi:hypothetical protein